MSKWLILPIFQDAFIKILSNLFLVDFCYVSYAGILLLFILLLCLQYMTECTYFSGRFYEDLAYRGASLTMVWTKPHAGTGGAGDCGVLCDLRAVAR